MKNFLPLILIVAVFAAACSSEKILSRWDDNTIIVDGKVDDWGDNLILLEDKNIELGVYNNEEHLYICFTSADKLDIMQIINMGMTLWLIPTSGNAETRGLKYPIKSEDFDIQQMKEKRLIGYEEDFVKNLLEANAQKIAEVQVVNEKDYSLYVYPLKRESGINIILGESRDRLVYECSIQLAGTGDNEFSLGLMPGDDLIVGIETTKYSRPKRGGGDAGSESGRSQEVNLTGVPGVEIYSRPDPVDIKVLVTLAEAD